MKKIMWLLVLCLVSSVAEAKDKTRIWVNKITIEVHVGNIVYISKIKTPEKLELVRVWKGSDSLLYDLSATGADYSQSYSNTPKQPMSAPEAARKWADYLKKFEDLRKDLEVLVDE